MIGQTVGNYRILKLLGEGGMGAVYLAEHPGIGRKAAVKVLHPGLARNDEVVTRFFNEARAANAVRHPGIVEIFDFGTLASGATYIIMEFLPGESLAARIRRVGRLPIAEAIELAGQTSEVLGAAHAQGIVHRDLKPDNLFVNPDTHNREREMLKVLDFGIAKLSAEASPGSGSVKTRTGTIMGTPIYMSPEQCRGTKVVDHRADIYSLGIILYEMVCGEPPFVSEGQGDLIYMHIGTAPAPPSTHNPGIPKGLEDVILKALAKEPSARFQTMEELQRALTGTSPALAAPSPAFQPTPARAVPSTQIYPIEATPRSPRGGSPAQTTFSTAASMIDEASLSHRRRPRWVASISVGGAAIVAAGVWWFAGRTPPTPPSAPLHADVTPTNVPAAPSASAPHVPPENPTTMTVGLTSDPPGARVVRERDGADIAVTPFKGSWPARAGVEKLRIEMDGFVPERFTIPLDRSVDLSFALKKAPMPSAHRKKAHELSSATAPTKAAPAHSSPATPAPKPTPRPEPVPL